MKLEQKLEFWIGMHGRPESILLNKKDFDDEWLNNDLSEFDGIPVYWNHAITYSRLQYNAERSVHMKNVQTVSKQLWKWKHIKENQMSENQIYGTHKIYSVYSYEDDVARETIYVVAETFKDASDTFRKHFKHLEPYHVECSRGQDYRTLVGKCNQQGTGTTYRLSYHTFDKDGKALVLEGTQRITICAENMTEALRKFDRTHKDCKVWECNRKQEKVLVA